MLYQINFCNLHAATANLMNFIVEVFLLTVFFNLLGVFSDFAEVGY